MEFTNLHARPKRFSQCFAYIVTNWAYLNICMYFNFGELKKKMTKMVQNFGELVLYDLFKNIYDNFYEFIVS